MSASKAGLFLFILLFFIPQTLLAQPKSEESGWRDKSPHKSDFIQVNGIKLHYLDWGGRGKPLLFLADIGFSAHIFDDIAPKFTDRFRVFGLTRRGHGQSEKTTDGYDNDTLIQDIRQFLDKKGIKSVLLVGHGLAGTEITHFAGLFPDRVEKIIHLNSAYDSEDSGTVAYRYEEALQSLPPPPAYPQRDNSTYDSLRLWAKLRLGCWSEAMESELRASIIRHPNGKIEDAMTPRTEASLRKGATVTSAAFEKVKAPMLSFFALDSVRSVFPWITKEASDSQRQAAQEFVDFGNRQKREQIMRLKKGGDRRQIVELMDTVHLCFIAKQDEIVQKMRAFLLEK